MFAMRRFFNSAYYWRLYENHCSRENQGSWKDRLIQLGPTIIGFLFALYLLYSLFQILYAETYVWQVMDLGNMIQPVARKTCSLPAIPNTKSLSLPSKNKKIAFLMIYDNADGNWNKELMQRVIKNREKYCNLYGFELINGNDQLDHSRPPAWSKLKAMDHYLYKYDYLIYIDMDVIIMNFDRDYINDYIELGTKKDFIMTEDWSGVNTGVWIAKNTPFTHWFLQTAWNQTQLIPRLSPVGIPYPFEYEQRSFHFLLQTKVWQQRHLQVYRGDYKELRDHFLILPQCSMNSYIMYPYYWKGDREVSHYVQGDFLVHFAGKKGKVKTNLMNYFLDVAE
eukprot:gene4864-5218_t